MLFRQLFDQDSSTYTYLLADAETRESVLIDPVIEQADRDSTLLEELGLQLSYVLDTHVHADHVTALGVLKRRFGAKTGLSERAGVVCADILLKQGDRLRFGRHELEVRETPGHTSGCLTYLTREPSMAFTGDALLIRGSGRTDFQNGSSATLYRSVHEQVFSLPDETLIYPGHDYKGRTVSTVGEEKRHNPRLGDGKSSSDFERIMSELSLPYPRKMDLAVPANLMCGIGVAEIAAVGVPGPSFAPLTLSRTSVPEVSPAWLASNLDRVTMIDVRDPDEFRGALGHIAGAELVPLQTLEARVTTLPRGRPLITICRSGGRSGKAAVLLKSLGFPEVASLQGGMTEWNAQSLPVELGSAITNLVSRQG